MTEPATIPPLTEEQRQDRLDQWQRELAKWAEKGHISDGQMDALMACVTSGLPIQLSSYAEHSRHEAYMACRIELSIMGNFYS